MSNEAIWVPLAILTLVVGVGVIVTAPISLPCIYFYKKSQGKPMFPIMD